MSFIKLLFQQIPQQSELNLAAQNIETSPVDLAGPSNSSLSQPPSVPGKFI